MQFCKITLYFIWLHYFQKIQNPRCITILCDCIRSPQNLQLTVKRMHPSLGSWFGNPSFRYLWSQNLRQGKAEQLNPVTHSDRYLLLSCTNRWEKLTALYGSVTQRKVLPSASQVNKNSSTVIALFLLQEDAPYLWHGGEEGEGSFSFSRKSR